ncbi:MAG: nitroreductase family protein [Candidatus Omnitrophica bacterium]|nr:nitroreductase family protein [Candidatus Omnitrophota bacterium]
MNLLKAIHTRHSIRFFTAEPVDDQRIEDIIAAGMMACSAGNERPWHFIVIRQRKTLQAISRSHLYATAVKRAPVAILVCGDLTQDKYDGYWVQDCAAATQNMLLLAHNLGLGSVWIGLHPRSQRVADIRAIIPLPEHIVPFSILPLGYPAEVKINENRFNHGRIHYEKW